MTSSASLSELVQRNGPMPADVAAYILLTIGVEHDWTADEIRLQSTGHIETSAQARQRVPGAWPARQYALGTLLSEMTSSDDSKCAEICERATALTPGERYPNEATFVRMLEELKPAGAAGAAGYFSQPPRAQAKLVDLSPLPVTFGGVAHGKQEELELENSFAPVPIEQGARPSGVSAPYRDVIETPKNNSGRAVMLLATIVALIGAGGLALWHRTQGQPQHETQASGTTASAKPMLFINSEPSGAVVKIEGKMVGVTPWVQDNIFPPNELTVELSMRGYAARTVKFKGAANVRINETLALQK